MKRLNRSQTIIVLLSVIACFAILPNMSFAHCQIPCGIYDDNARVKGMLEDAATIEKSVKLLKELTPKKDTLSINQTVRWVANKESHADNIISTISNYFLTQRVKTAQPDYLERLKKHHAVILYAMKVKQTVDKENVNLLNKAINELLKYYPADSH